MMQGKAVAHLGLSCASTDCPCIPTTHLDCKYWLDLDKQRNYYLT